MAIYQNFNQINSYIKLASAKDFCYICAKKKGASHERDAYETMRELKGQIENQKVLYVNKSGIDVCICMDCLKEIYDQHIAPTLPNDEPSANKAEVEINNEDEKNSKKKSSSKK